MSLITWLIEFGNCYVHKVICIRTWLLASHRLLFKLIKNLKYSDILMKTATVGTVGIRLLGKDQNSSLFFFFFFKNGPFPASFPLFSSFQYTVDSKQMFYINKFLPMTGFEPRTSGIGSDRSTNWATTTALEFQS